MPIHIKQFQRGPKSLQRLMMASSLGRIYQHFNTGEFGIVSAFLSNLEEAENNQRNRELFDTLKGMGIGYVPIIGVYGAFERSVFLPQVEEEVVHELAAQFEQESYIWGEKGAWVMLDTNTGDILMEGNDFLASALDNEENYYSELDHRRFKFALKTRPAPKSF